MSGVPGGGYIGEFIMCSVFFPDQLAIAYPIAITIGNLVDPPATMINSAGDYVVSFLVSRFGRRQGLVPESPGQPERLIFPFAKRGPAAGQVLLSSSQLLFLGAALFPLCLHALSEWCGGETAQSGLPQLYRQPAAHVAHAVDHLSTGTRLSMPARAMSAALTAFTAPMTFRLTQGTSTSPATGSQIRPRKHWRLMAAASHACCAVPPIS